MKNSDYPPWALRPLMNGPLQVCSPITPLPVPLLWLQRTLCSSPSPQIPGLPRASRPLHMRGPPGDPSSSLSAHTLGCLRWSPRNPKAGGGTQHQCAHPHVCVRALHTPKQISAMSDAQMVDGHCFSRRKVDFFSKKLLSGRNMKKDF